MVSYFGKRSKEKASDHEEGSSQGGGEQWDGKEITSSMEKFSRFGFLTPALVLVPAADGHDLQSQRFKDVRGDNRELVLAAAHIEDAKTGRGRYGKAIYYFKPKHAQIAFKIITNGWFQKLIYIAVLLHSALTFIEPPTYPPRSKYAYAAVVLNLVCLLIYLTDIILNIIFLSWKIFWSLDENAWNRREFIFLCGFAIDWILLIAQVISDNTNIIQPFRTLRLAMIMCKAKNIGHIYSVVQSITLKLGGVVLIVFVFIFLYSCIGIHLVMTPYETILPINISTFRPIFDEGGTDDTSSQLNSSNTTVVFVDMNREPVITVNESNIYEGTFNHIGVAAYQLFILLTTENYPVFMFPALHYSQWYFTYFGTFLVFGVFFLTAILLAIIADFYWQHNKRHVKQERLKQRAELVKAWKLLDTQGQERLAVDDPKLINLFKILKPKNTEEEINELIAELDPDENGYVDWIQWVTQLISVLDLERTHRSDDTGSKHHCFKWYSNITKFTRKITNFGLFEKIVLLQIIIHSLLFALMWQGMPLKAEITIQAIRTAIIIGFVVEMMLRSFSNGIYSLLDALDLILVLIAVASNLIWYGSLAPSVVDSDGVNIRLWRGFTVVTSSLAIFGRLFFNSAQSRRVMTVFLRLFPVMLDLIILFAIIMYFYAVIGMEAFHEHEITLDTPTADHFLYNCGLGFINFRCSLYMLFQLLTTSNWHDIMNTLIVSLDSFAPLIYFISCYVVINLVIMNLLVAIGIEAFNKFSEEQKAESEEEGENGASGGASSSDDQSLCSIMSGKRLLKNIAVWTSAAFSSTREGDGFGDEVGSGIIDSNASGRRGTISASNERRRTSSQAWRPVATGPVLVKEFSMTMGSPRHVSFSPTSHGRSSQTSRGSTTSTLDCSLVALELGNDTGTPEVDDSAFSSPHVPVLPETNTTKEAFADIVPKLTRQEKLKKKLKEKQKEKIRLKFGPAEPAQQSARIPSPSGYLGDDDTTLVLPKDTVESCITNSDTHHWKPATKAITFANHVAEIAYTDLEAGDEVGDLQKINKRAPRRRNSVTNGPKFRRAYNRGNWRSEVQNITIINKEEISQLRRQLNSKPALRTRKISNAASSPQGYSYETGTPVDSNLSHQDSILSMGNIEVHDILSKQHGYTRRASNNSDDLHFDLARFQRRHSSVTSETDSLSTGQTSMTSVDEDQGSTMDSTMIARRFGLAPLISVEEVPEVEHLNTPLDDQKLCIPGSSSMGEVRSKRAGSTKKRQRPKEMPEWVLKLTQQYNVAVHTEGTKENEQAQ